MSVSTLRFLTTTVEPEAAKTKMSMEMNSERATLQVSGECHLGSYGSWLGAPFFTNGERERGKSCRGVRNKKGVHKIETLNKPYGFGSFNNRSHIPLFGTGSCWTEAKHLMTSSLFKKCSPFLASSLVGPRHIVLFGTDFERTETYSSLWLRVLTEPRHKTWLELQKCHRVIICFGFWPTEAYKAR